MSKLCSICGGKTCPVSRVKVHDGYVCSSCTKKAMGYEGKKVDDYKDRLDYLEKNKMLWESFKATDGAKGFIEIDEANQLFRLNDSKECFPFSALRDYKLHLEPLFKGRTKGMCIYIALNNRWLRDAEIVIFRNKNVKIKGFRYHVYENLASKALYLLDIINNYNKENLGATDDPLATKNLSVADEILKYKKLLDMEAITIDEYEKKKDQLLNL